jgi:hypothetical protein
VTRRASIVVAIVIAIAVGAVIGAITGVMRNQGMLTMSGGVVGTLAAVFTSAIALAILRKKSSGPVEK